jgi:hypothetical protein
MTRIYIAILIITISFFSCDFKNESKPILTKKKPPKINSIGRVNHLLVVSDNDLWESEIQKTLNYQLDNAFILPIDEMCFSFKQRTSNHFNKEIKKTRSIIFLATLDNNSPTTSYIKSLLGKDRLSQFKENDSLRIFNATNKWAQPQYITFVVAGNYNALQQGLTFRGMDLSKKIRDDELAAYKMTVIYKKQSNKKSEKAINKKFNVEMHIPKEYKVIIDENEFIWIRKELTKGWASIALYSVPYTSEEDFKIDKLILRRNNIVGKHIEGQLNNTPMMTDTIIEPIYRTIKIGAKYTVEISGLWRLKNDFMGGAFVNYAILDDRSNKILFADVFLHHSEVGKQIKKKYMVELMSIVRTIKFKNKNVS